ncbi:MAG: hypothetical protein KJ726_00380 [Verrucomicrobia bacterium]|nr:hypothetical protein [Verrucomicrobiota bacterium]MBU1908486.1 hypothetical protein [Verrucomicrobiota bacterium]
MKKVLVCLLIATFVMAVVGPVQAADKGAGRGGLMGFIAGCCFGIRAGAAYNDGKEIHWREWVSLVPIVNIVVAIWNGIEGANGVTSKDYATQYGAMYY